MQNGYTPALIRKRDRMKYISSLEKAQLGGSKDDYYKIIKDAVNRSLDIYWDAVTGAEPVKPTQATSLLKIGALAKATGESNATLRYWVKESLLEVEDTTESGYQLFSPQMIDRVALIRDLQSQRYTLSEIRLKIS